MRAISTLVLTLSAVCARETYLWASNISSVLDLKFARPNVDYSFTTMPTNEAAAIVCHSNCQALASPFAIELSRNDDAADLLWYMVRLGGPKEEFSPYERIEQLFTDDENAKGAQVSLRFSYAEQCEDVNASCYHYIVVATNNVRVFERFILPGSPPKQPLTFTVEQEPLPQNVVDSIDLDNANPTVIQDIINRVTTADYRQRVRELSGDTPYTLDGRSVTQVTRFTLNVGHRTAFDYARQFFAANGLEVREQTYTVQGQTTRNIIGIKRGVTTPNNIVVIGGHLDCTSQATATAPGAVDNGSGAAAVMNLAAAFRTYNFENTIHFIVFGGEEQGLVGSTWYVNNRASQFPGATWVSVLTMDMIAYSNRFYGVIIEGTTNSAIQQLMNRLEAAYQQWAPRLSIQRSNNSFGSDHVPFQRAGIPAILAIERDDTNYPCYHRTCDTIQYVNVDQSVDIARGIIAVAVNDARVRL